MAHEQPVPTQQLSTTPAPTLPELSIFELVPDSPVPGPYVYEPRYSPEYTDSEKSALSAFGPCPNPSTPCLPPEQLVTQDTIALLYAYIRQFYPSYTDSEISALVAFWDHPNAPKPCPPPQQPVPQEVEGQLYVPTSYTHPGYTDPDTSALGAFGVHPNAPGPCAPSQQPISPEAEIQLHVPASHFSSEYTDSERSALGAFDSTAPDPCPSSQQPIPHEAFTHEAFTHEAVTPSFARKRGNNVRHGCKMLKSKGLRGEYLTKNKRLSNRRLVTTYPKSESIRRERVQGRLLKGPIPTNRDAGLRHCRLRFVNRRRYNRWLKVERVRRSLDGAQTMVPGTTTPIPIMPTDGLSSEVIPHPISAPEATNVTPAVAPVGFPVSQPVPAPADVQAPNQQPASQTADYPPEGMAPNPSMNDASASSSLPTTSATTPSVPAPVVSAAPAADDDDEDDNNLIKSHRKVRRNIALFTEGPMKWMPEKVAYGLKEALKDLKAANRRSKRRLLSRKRPISLTGSMKFSKNFEGLMPGDRMARPQAKRDWINAYMQLVLDKRCGRVPADATLPPRQVQKSDSKAAGEKEQKDPADADGDDAENKTAEGVVDDDFDILPPGWAMGDDEVGGGVDDFTVYQHYTSSGPATTDDSQANEEEADSQATDQPADVISTVDVRASGLESMMSKMKIQHGAFSSHTGQNPLAPVPPFAVR